MLLRLVAWVLGTPVIEGTLFRERSCGFPFYFGLSLRLPLALCASLFSPRDSYSWG